MPKGSQKTYWANEEACKNILHLLQAADKPLQYQTTTLGIKANAVFCDIKVLSTTGHVNNRLIAANKTFNKIETNERPRISSTFSV